MCVASFTGLPPPFLHTANDKKKKKKNWTVERPGNETKMCKQYFHLFCVQEFPPVIITDKTGKVLDEKCKI